MSYELTHNTTRRAPKLSTPAIAKAYRKLPKEDKRMSETDTSGPDCGHVLNVSATERLRELLDERGVEWSAQDRFTRDVETRWFFPASSALFTEYEDGMTIMVISGAEWTPEQAIAATLGREKCLTGSTFLYNPKQAVARVCLTCGHDCVVETLSSLPNYCPVCGKKVEHE